MSTIQHVAGAARPQGWKSGWLQTAEMLREGRRNKEGLLRRKALIQTQPCFQLQSDDDGTCQYFPPCSGMHVFRQFNSCLLLYPHPSVLYTGCAVRGYPYMLVRKLRTLWFSLGDASPGSGCRNYRGLGFAPFVETGEELRLHNGQQHYVRQGLAFFFKLK